jgi:transposase
MNLYAGLDVSLKETSVCIVNGEGAVLLERKVLSEPDAITTLLRDHTPKLQHVGLEACSLACWLQVELRQRGLPAVVIESKHTHVSLSTMRNKTDRNDARGIAQLMRLGWFKVVHVKSPEAQGLRLLFWFANLSTPRTRYAAACGCSVSKLGPLVADASHCGCTTWWPT